jgi:CRISPR-associated protein (TIGR03984 family)
MTTESKESENLLYGQSESNISLEDTLKKDFGNLLSGAIGLFYSPQACDFGRICKDGTVAILRGNQLETLKLSEVFEARIFNLTAELRWLNILGEGGKAVLLSDGETSPKKILTTSIEPIAYVEKLEQTYLLWGEPIERKPPDNWDFLATARIGTLAVPQPEGEKSDYVVLNSREYLGVGKYGNLSIVQERLVNLTWEKKDESN